MNSLRRLSLVALAVTLPAPIAAQVPDDAGQRVDQIFRRWSSMTSPGCAVGVTKDGLTILERAYGMADLEHDIPNTPETIFEGGSVSKQFTSAAIMLLVLDGKLSLEDDVRTYIPEVPDYGTPITLHRMMTHTSGLRDWGSVAGISGWGREQRSHDHDDVLDIVSRQSALNFEPGHEHSYSNTGFNLLAVVVARVSGMPFADFSKKRIFEPLGMRNTQWRDDYRRLVPGRSTAYSSANGGGWEINRPIEYVHGNGGILTTVEEASDPPEPAHQLLATPEADRFAGLYQDPVTGQTRELLVEDGLLRDGAAILDLVWEDRTFEVPSQLRSYVFDRDIESFGITAWQYTDQRYERVEPWTPTPSDFAAYVGTYYSAEAETTYVVHVEGDELTVGQRPNVTRTLQPVYRDGFRSQGSVIRFRRDGAGRVVALSLSLGRVYDMRFERVESLAPLAIL